MKRHGDHVTIGMNDGLLHCTHCGDSYTINLPAPMDIVIACIGAYGRLHRGCKPPKADP